MAAISVNNITVKALARSVGFDVAGVAAAEPTVEWLFYPEWLRRGYAGGMDYLAGRRGEMRQNPKTLLAEARSIICAGLVYNTSQPYSVEVEAGGRGWVSRYAWGEDYHKVVRDKLRALAGALEAEQGPFQYKICVDTAPLLERAYAHQAGLGWVAKNSCLINQQLGSWIFLGELITSLELEPDGPAPFRCGTCTRCIDACPTEALVPTGLPDGPEYALDSRHCISYWTIELRGGIAEENRGEVGQHVFGCDICQDVCPWNRRAAVTESAEFQARNQLPDLAELAEMTPEQFHERFGGTAVERTRYRGFLRNVAIALGNSGDAELLEPLRRLGRHQDEVIREHAQWAIHRIEQGRGESTPFRLPQADDPARTTESMDGGPRRPDQPNR